jgi:HlyD family secretion protein
MTPSFLKHRFIKFLWIPLLIIIIGAWFLLPTKKEELPSPYSLTPIKRGNLTATVSATGTLNPVITVTIGSQVSGTIQSLDVDFNSHVKKGQVIAQIDPALYKASLAEANANLMSAQASRDEQAVEVKDAKRKLKRVEDLFKQKLVSDSDLDTARFAYEAATVQQRVKQAAVAQAEAARERQQVNLAYTTIYAPIDGVVISRDVDVGQTVAASLQAPTLFTIAKDLTAMQIETDVDEAFIGMIKDNQPATFTVFAYQGRLFHGHVAQIRLKPKIDAGVVKYNCIIYVDNSDLALKPGMTATVSIEVAHREGVLKVPNTALRYVPEMPEAQLKKIRESLKPNEAVLWVEQGNNQLKPVTVKMGLAGEKETEVIGDQLHEGMKVAVPGKNDGSARRRHFGLSLF